MTFKTLPEQEREAYITGHVFMADLLAKADDAELAESLHEDRVAELQTEIDGLQETVIELQETLEEAVIDAAEWKAEARELRK
jgi:hypothetical protein